MTAESSAWAARGDAGVRPRLSIGLTGGIGSGKSTVANLLLEHGAHLVDTDAIARRITAPGGAAIPSIAEAFGADVVSGDGALDRDRMRERVFADPAAKKRLESLLHPMIGAVARQEAAMAGHGTVVFDVPLLTESAHWRARVDRILVVDCPETLQAQRVMQRNGWPEDAVRRVIAQQATREARRAIADAVIHNEGLDLQALAREVAALWGHWHRHL